jgi:hypothetical protein
MTPKKVAEAVSDSNIKKLILVHRYPELDNVDITAGTRKPWITLDKGVGAPPDNANLWGDTTITDGRNINLGQLTFAVASPGHRLHSRSDGLSLSDLYNRWTGVNIPPTSDGSFTIYSDTYDAFGVFTENSTLEKKYGINTGLVTPATDTANYKSLTETIKTDGSVNNLYKEIKSGSSDKSYLGTGFFGMDSKSATPTEGQGTFGKYYIKNNKPYFVDASGTDKELTTGGNQRFNFTLAFTSTPEDNEFTVMEGLIPENMSITNLRVSIFGESTDSIDIGIYKRVLNGSDEFTETDSLSTITELTSIAGASTAGMGGKFYSYTDGQLSNVTASEGEIFLARINSVTGTPDKIIFNLTCE